MRILVSGASGFIGGALARRLAGDPSHQVIFGVRDPAKFDRSSLPPRASVVRLALEEAEHIDRAALGEPDLLVHAAWRDYRSVHDRAQVDFNLPRSLQLVRRLVDQGLSRVAVIGSGFEYGQAFGPLAEDRTPEPGTHYAVAKHTLYRLLSIELAKTGTPFQWLRVFNVYGPGQHPRSIFGLLDTAIAAGEVEFPMSWGEQLRDYIHIDDLAEILAAACLQDRVTGVINCASGVAVSMRRLAEWYAAAQKSGIRFRFGAVPYVATESLAYWADITRLRQALGNTPGLPRVRHAAE